MNIWRIALRLLAGLTGLVAITLAMTACGSSERQLAVGISAPAGFEVRIYADGLDGPTQMIFAPNGDLIVAELNGGEKDATGRVLRLSGDDLDQRTVIQTALDKPTGIALTGDRLWIMEQQQLSVTTLEPDAPREIVFEDMPYNGRSQGTLTVTASGQLLYNTSGSKRGPDRVPGSGALFAIDDAAGGPGEPKVLATGFKHAYAHLVDPEGQLWTVEMTDGSFDDERAPDELVAVAPGDDGGWPQCVGDNRAVIEYGGSDELCAASPQSHAIFGLGATPTSFVIAPWNPDLFVAALWLPGQVVTVPRPTASEPHDPSVFIEGVESPQHLLVDGDDLLISDHETGQIFVVSRTP